MAKNPKLSESQELAAVNGPVEEIGHLQTELGAILASVLERRNAIRRYFGSDDESEAEVAHLVALFTSSNRRAISNKILQVYMLNRYQTIQTIEPNPPTSAPKDPYAEFSSGIGLPVPKK